ncbi:TonB-dependent receptor plug domain-containing protein [uncultured Aquimarina sp.]|uniref:TonB-dependent receptor plug domain-containing protein n=1 Tax=uncultured Aquimarina sp. TaxID=575652 RepID=UPI00260CC103|nr:TonB-dependent receptor plug domain-containing protein [uncultured Aquimarina sp.]
MNLHKLLFFLSLILLPIALSAQYNIRVEAYVIDQFSNKPIPYTNVGFIDQGIGTVTKKDGFFSLFYDELSVKKTAIIKFSKTGYQTLTLSAGEFYNLLTKDNKISLKPISKFLEEKENKISGKYQINTLGCSTDEFNHNLSWKNNQSLGSEIASLIKLGQKNVQVDKVRFNILKNASDSILVRVNVYNERLGKPKKNILSKNIYHTISAKEGEETIDLSPYNITLQNDFAIALELVEVYGDVVDFQIGSSDQGKVYSRAINQSKWKQVYESGGAFAIETADLIPDNIGKRRQQPDHITIYWDTSLSMENRNLDREKRLLQEYLSSVGDVKVDLIPFSNHIRKKQTFKVIEGRSENILSAIEGLKYNGASNFSELFLKENPTDMYVVFTDGLATYGEHEFNYNTPIFFINSKQEGDHATLQQISRYSNGFYIHLSKNSITEARKHLQFHTIDTYVYDEKWNTRELISSTVFENESPIQGCTVRVKGTFVETETNANGEFSIDAEYDDVLVFEHFAMKAKEISVEDVKKAKVQLTVRYDKLDQVDISSKSDKNKVTKKKRNLINAVKTITSEDFPPSAIFLSDLIRGRLPGVRVNGTGDLARYTVRGPNTRGLSRNPRPSIGPGSEFIPSVDPIFIVDDIPFRKPPNFLHPFQIKSISVISGIQGSIRYGTDGVGGVIIIETKVGSGDFYKKEVDTLLVKGNDYNESVLLLDISKNRPEYLRELWNSTSYDEALASYYKLKEEYAFKVPFYIYASEYFMRWDKKFSEEVLSNLAEVGTNNYKAIRSLAFKLEEMQQIDKALWFYEKLIKLKPGYAQSYLDLARVYTENKKYTKALDMYEEMLANKHQQAEFDGVSKQLISQFRSFLNNHRSEIAYEDIPKDYLKVHSVPARIVFDWNDPNASFELQFVNPENKYFKWSHNYEDQPKELLKELEQGIVSKEFVLDKTFKGQWTVNIKCLNENISEMNPVFMKYTIYHDYGLPEERKEVKFIKLYNQQEKVSLDKFEI